MTQKSISGLQLYDVFKQVLNETKIVTMENCEAVWQCFSKTVISQVDTQKSVLVFDMFYIKSKTIKNLNIYEWIPTLSLLDRCQINYEQQIPQLTMVSMVTKQKLARNFLKEESLSKIGNSEDVGWSILEYIFKTIKQSLTGVQNIEISIGYFGMLKVEHRILKHIVREDRNIRIKKLMSPRKKNSILRISRRSSQNLLGMEEEGLENNSQEDSIVLRPKKSSNLNILSPLGKSVNFLNIHKEVAVNYKQRSFMNNFAIPDTRISNDLLGAGIDPLKYDYNYSKLVNDTSKLFNKTFTKPKPAKIRHPGIIDKFQRTAGVPQTGLKVSNSVIVRIGSNYNRFARHIYCDIKQKTILFVPREPKIILTENSKLQVQCATQEEEYKYVTENIKHLEEKVQQRISNYKRYCKYIDKYIDNNNVCPISSESIKRILDQVRNCVAGFTNPGHVEIANQVMNQANKEYYRAYKKSILDYILKDEKEKERTSIHAFFDPPVEWGERKVKVDSPLYTCKVDKTNRAKVSKMLTDHLYHPKCVLQIANFNLKMKDLDLFRIKNQDSKPVNVLYFIKKQHTHIADILSYLSSDWIKKVSSIVTKYIDFETEPEKKTSTFIRLINVMLSNTLKNVVYQSFNKLVSFFNKFSKHSATFQHPILQISMTDDNGKFVLSDDFKKILTDQIRNLIVTIVDESKKIHGVEFYLKDQSSSFLWNQDKNDLFYEETIGKIIAIIDENCVEIDKFKTDFDEYQTVLKFQEHTIDWLKVPRSLEEITTKCLEIEQMEAKVETIPYCFVNKMVIIECFDQKEKLKSYLSQLRGQVHQSLKSLVERSNFKSFTEIEEIKRTISMPIENTSDYMKVASELEEIKKKKFHHLMTEMQYNRKCLLKLLDIGYGSINVDLMEKIFMTNKILRTLNSKIQYHEDRLNREKTYLQSKLRQKIKAFQASTQTYLSTISARIDQFELRRVYNDYLVEINGFKNTVDENNATVDDLNKQQEDLKWSKTAFKAAEELKNIVMPNYDLWTLVMQFDYMMKQWKNKEICQMDVAQLKKRVEEVNTKVSKTIKKLKNLSSLKVAYELQKDTKDILHKHVQIIEIFSHPGLKERHWQLFNTKLMIPGVDLKQIPYSKIKIFEEYQKNLKVLSVISTQAAKQFQIENERNEQLQYWMTVTFETYSSASQNNFCISELFLTTCLSILEEHSNKLAVMKNYLYSKALYQQLQEWELWLSSSKKNLQNLRTIQAELSILRPLFSYEQIAKQLPIENSQFESIDNYWKTLTKKIWEHSKLYEFMKSPKISEMIEELLKKIQVLKRGAPLFLMTKRSQFPRFYFINDAKLTNLLAKAASSTTQKEATNSAFELCFPQSASLIQNDQKFLCIKSETESLMLTSDVYQLKSKKKFCENLTFLQKCMRESVRTEIVSLLKSNFLNDLEDIIQKYCLTSIFCQRNISFGVQLLHSISESDFGQMLGQRRTVIRKLVDIIKREKREMKKDAIKKIMRVQKMLLSAVGEIDRIQKLAQLREFNVDSFEYLSIVKFVVKTKENYLECSESAGEGKIGESKLEEKNKQVRWKLNSVCRTIHSLRRPSLRCGKTIMSNSRIHIEVMNKSLEYREEFWGDETHNYMPSFSEKASFLMLNTLMCNKINCLPFSKASTVARKLAIICGQHFAQIDVQFFGEEQGLSSLLHGIASSRTWIFVHCEKLKLKHRNYDKLNSLVCEIRQKKQETQRNDIQVPLHSGYLKSLSQVCDISLSSACFLHFGELTKFEDIPQSFRAQMRPVVLTLPPFVQFLKNECKKFTEATAADEKCGQNWITEATSFYHKPQAARMQVKEALQLQSSLSHALSPKIKCQLLEEYINNKFESVPSSKDSTQFMLQVLSASLELKQSAKEQIHHQSSLTAGSLLKQKQKVTYNQLQARYISELANCLEKYDVAILYGRFDVKTAITMEVLQQFPGYSQLDRHLYSFPACTLEIPFVQSFIGSTVEALVIQLNKIFTHKSYKKIAKESKRHIFLHFQYTSQLRQETLSALLAAVTAIEQRGVAFEENSSKYELKIKLILDCMEITHIAPSTALKVGKVYLQMPEEFALQQYFNDWLLENIKIDKQRSEDSRVNYESVMYSLKCLEPTFQQILALALKSQPCKSSQSVMDIKYALTLMFLRMFKTYIDHLDNKEIDEYVEYDVNSYINNSFIYCVYWTICVGFMKPHQHFIIEQALLKEHFPEITDIEEISKYMLNEENEWLNWSTLKEEFTLIDAKNIPIYNVWVSTEENMKIYTNVIKMLEKGLRVLVLGEKCSGKSILLKEISNFQMSYTSFLIDCNRTTRAEEVAEVIKNRIFYTKKEKKLILIDDIHLPHQEPQINQIVKKLIEDNTLCCKFDYCRKYWNNKKLDSHLSVLMTCSSELPRPEENELSVAMLDSCVQRFNIRELIEVDISTIYGAYIGYQFDRLKLKVCEKAGQLEAIFSGFMCKIFRKFNVTFHTLNRIVKLFFTKIQDYVGVQKKEEEPMTQNKKILSPFDCIKMVNQSIFTILGSKPNFDAIASVCLEETNKALSSNNFKHQEQFCQKIYAEKYNHLPPLLTLVKSWNGQNISEKHPRERAEIVGNLIQQCLADKNEGIQYIPTSVHNELILKMYSLLKVCPSHIIILSEISSSNHKSDQESKWIEANGLGMRTLIKIATFLLSINFNQVEHDSVSNFFSDSLNIIKAGGKIDESVYYVCRNQFKALLHGQSSGKEMISAINSFISSPQLYEFFTEQRIQQIFVKFSSEKKTLKRSEFIRKVREKIHLLFHFVLSIDAESYNFLAKNYPNIIKQCHVIQAQKLPEESLYEIANKVLRPQGQKKTNKDILSNPSIESSISINLPVAQPTVESQKNKRNVINSLLQIYYNFENLMKSRFKQNHAAYIIRYKMRNIYEYFQIFRSLKKKYDELNKKEEMNGEVWSSRRRDTELKYEQLVQEKAKLYAENEAYFKKSAVLTTENDKRNEKYLKLAQQANNLQVELKSQSDHLKSRKHDSHEYKLWQQYQSLLDLQDQMKELPHQQFENLYKNGKVDRKMKILNKNSQTFDLDFKTNILEGIERLRLFKSNNMKDLMEEFVAELAGVEQEDEKASDSELGSIFILWQKEFIKFVNKMNENTQLIKNQESLVASIQLKIKENKALQKKIQDQNETAKNQLSSEFSESSKISSHYQQICRMVEQIEPILNIFKHFQKVIKANNRKKDKETGKEADAMAIIKTYGSLIMASAYIAFGFYIGLEEDQRRFWNDAKSVIRANGLDIDDAGIFDSVLNSEEAFKNKYRSIEGNDFHTVCQIGLNSNTCSVVRIGEQEVLKFYSWVERTSERTVKIIEVNSEVSQINECLSNGYIGLVVNPSAQLVKKLRPLINYDVELKNNAISINISEQIIINTTSRIIFVVTPGYIQEGKFINSILTNLWHLNFQQLAQSTQRESEIKSLLNRKSNRRNDLIDEHLQLFQQLSRIDKKIEKMIMTIRKNNENPDRIIIKIEAISEEKQAVMARMEHIVEELAKIDTAFVKETAAIEEDKDIKHIIQTLLSHCNSTSMLQSSQLIEYLEVLVKGHNYSIPTVKQRIEQYAQLFSDRKSTNIQSTRELPKFKRIQKEETSNLEDNLEAILLQIPSRKKNNCSPSIHAKWYHYLTNIFNLHPSASQGNLPSQKCMEMPRITVNNKALDQSTPAVLVSPSPCALKRASKSLLVYRTRHSDTMGKYFLTLLVENKQQANYKEINCLAQYNARNIASENLINIVEVRNFKDWRYVSSYLTIENEKKSSQKLIILCDPQMAIPAHIQPHVHSVYGGNEMRQLTSVMCKLGNITIDYEDTTWAIEAEVRRSGRWASTNQQEIIEEVVSVEQIKMKASDKSKYLVAMLAD